MEYEELRESIIETNYYLTVAIFNNDVKEIVRKKSLLDKLIEEILNKMENKSN